MPLPPAYNDRAQQFFDRYEAQETSDIQRLLARWIPAGTDVLELGCGSGRDARFLVQLGANVIATDGSEALLNLAQQHDDGSTHLRFASLTLPPSPSDQTALAQHISTPNHKVRAVYTCGVLQHLTDHELHETVRFINRITDEQGLVILIVPLNHQGEPDRLTFTREKYDYIQSFERIGFRLADSHLTDDAGTPGFTCTWATFVFLRETGSQRANQRFRRILENDAKTATYKLALLRALCDINRTMPRLVRFENDEALIPVGLIAERWIRDYWQLAQDGRMPRQIRQGARLAFEQHLEVMMQQCANSYSLFEELLNRPTRNDALNQCITTLFDNVVTTLFKGPVQYITEDDNPIFHRAQVRLSKRTPLTDRRSLFTRYGDLAFPAELWLELTRIAPWLEDSIVLEWAKLSARFESLSTVIQTPLTMADIVVRLMPNDTARDTSFAQSIYHHALKTDGLHCIWSGRELTANTMAVDHVLPWARFHNNHLWNLMPTHRQSNGQKSDAIPSCDGLYDARAEIQANWRRLYDASPQRFLIEAEWSLTRTPLPTNQWEVPLFDALLETADISANQLQATRWP